MKQVQVLSNKEKARQRINVFHGSNANWINIIKELVGNSLDVFNHNKKNYITITIHDKNKIEYMDSGCGIPVEGIASDGSYNYQALFETDFAGTKYGNEAATVGQNGIFLFTLTMTSENIEYFISRPDGNIYNIAYHKGDISKEFNICGKSSTTYSKMIFELDKTVWNNPNFTFDTISTIAKNQAAMGNVEIKVIDIQNNKKEMYYYPNGIKTYFNDMIIDKTIIADTIKINKDILQDMGGVVEDKDKISVDLLLSYSNDAFDDFRKDFLNTADLLFYGTIQEGIVLGLKNTLNRYIKSKSLYNKNEKQITNEDVLGGLNYICNVKSIYASISYENQTKVKTSSKHYQMALQSIIEEYMEIFVIENSKIIETIANQVLINKRAREKAGVTRREIKKSLEEKVTNASNRPAKFVPCRSKNPKEIELILIEGDSAMNSVKLSRNPNTMCIYPLKGKPINAFKKNLDQIINNQEVKDIFKILGCGMTYKGKKIKDTPKFDIKNLMADKIQITTDFDNDGFHIQSLLIGLFYILAPELIKQGKVYILYTPLYVITSGKEEYMAYSENERNEIIKKLNGNFKETRFKGIGGLSVKTMSKTAMHPENRIMKQITMEDVEKCIETLELFLSEESLQERKNYIEEFGDNYFDYSLLEG